MQKHAFKNLVAFICLTFAACDDDSATVDVDAATDTLDGETSVDTAVSGDGGRDSDRFVQSPGFFVDADGTDSLDGAANFDAMQAAKPTLKNLIVFVTPHGMLRSVWRPAGSGMKFELDDMNKVLSRLRPLRKHLTVLDGLALANQPSQAEGHTWEAATLLTGTNASGTGLSRKASSESLDYALAGANHVALGLADHSAWSWQKANTPVVEFPDPLSAYKAKFLAEPPTSSPYANSTDFASSMLAFADLAVELVTKQKTTSVTINASYTKLPCLSAGDLNQDLMHMAQSNLTKYTACVAFYSEVFERIVAGMLDTKINGHSLLDESIVLWITDQYVPNSHTVYDDGKPGLPIVMASGDAAGLAKGQYMNLPGRTHVDLLYSWAAKLNAPASWRQGLSRAKFIDELSAP